MQHVERLGDASLLYVQVGAGQPTMTVEVDGHASNGVGEPVNMHLLPQRLYVFDAQEYACRRTVDLSA